MNQVDAVIGWRVFHFWNPERMDFIPFAPERIPRIAYIPISIPVYTRDINISNAFIQFVLSPKGREIYANHGYLSSLEEAKKFAPGAAIGGEYKLPSKYFDLIKNIWDKK
jgi:molybdate transport system substrate-binding protein